MLLLDSFNQLVLCQGGALALAARTPGSPAAPQVNIILYYTLLYYYIRYNTILYGARRPRRKCLAVRALKEDARNQTSLKQTPKTERSLKNRPRSLKNRPIPPQAPAPSKTTTPSPLKKQVEELRLRVRAEAERLGAARFPAPTVIECEQGSSKVHFTFLIRYYFTALLLYFDSTLVVVQSALIRVREGLLQGERCWAGPGLRRNRAASLAHTDTTRALSARARPALARIRGAHRNESYQSCPRGAASPPDKMPLRTPKARYPHPHPHHPHSHSHPHPTPPPSTITH